MLKRVRKGFVGLLFVLLSGLAVTALGSGRAGSKPNMIVVLLDDLGFSDLGCYGGEIDTPVIDGLAEAGLRFSRFTNAAKCTTSRYSLLAGQYHGSGYHKMKRSTTLVEPLQKAGYATWGIGKWDTHNTTPLDYGFEKFFGFVNGSSDYVAGNGRWLLNENRFTEFGQDASEFYATRNLTDYLIQFLKEKEEAKDKRPFFAYVAYNAPHGPLQAEEDLEKRVRL